MLLSRKHVSRIADQYPYPWNMFHAQPINTPIPETRFTHSPSTIIDATKEYPHLAQVDYLIM